MQRPALARDRKKDHGRHRRGPPPRGAASWRKDHPIGFVARPRSKADGSTDLLNWDVVIPIGKKDTMFCAVSVLRLGVTRGGERRGVASTPRGRHRLEESRDAQVGRLRVQPHGCDLRDYPATAPVVKFVSRPGRELCGNQRHRRWQLRRRSSRRWRGASRNDFHTGLLAPRVDQRAHLLNLLNEPDGTWHGQWSPSITIKQILCAILGCLTTRSPPARGPRSTLYERNRPASSSGDSGRIGRVTGSGILPDDDVRSVRPHPCSRSCVF